VLYNNKIVIIFM